MAAQMSQKTLQRQNMMLTEPLPKVILQMAYPTIISFLINQIYSLADTYFVSGLGTNAAAAVSVNASLDQVIMMAGSLLAIGATSYISRLLGSGQQEKASQVLSTAFYTAMAFGLIVAVLGFAFMDPMVTLLGATATCKEYAIDYATYVLLVAPFMTATFVMNQCLRGEGSALLSMIGMSIGGILNCILDPVFIFGTEGLKAAYGIALPFHVEAMGVAGASIATAISKFVSFGILIFPYITRRSLLHLSLRNFLPSKDIIFNVVSVGSSSLFRNGLNVVSAIMLNNIAGDISDSVLAAVGVSNKIMMFPFCIILGFGNGFQPVAGFNWGAKRYDRVEESYRFSTKVAIIGSVVMAAIIALFCDQLIVVFAGTDAEMRRIGAICILAQCVALPAHAWVAIVNMLCVGLGNATGAMLLATSRQGSCFIPVVHLMALLFGAYGVASVQALADLLSLALAVPIALAMKKKIDAARETQRSLI